MKVLSAAEMQACDRVTVDRHGIASLALMRAAAKAVAELALGHFGGLWRKNSGVAPRVTVLCGRGNNGGDGLMVARLLVEAGCAATVVLLGAEDGLRGDAAMAWGELESRKGNPPGMLRIEVVTDAGELAGIVEVLDCDLIVDAVVGTGFKAPLRGLPLAALHWLQAAAGQPVRRRVPVLAVDLPSGWDADSTGAAPEGPVFPADAVVTFTAPKSAHGFGQLTRGWDGPVVVAPIGSPAGTVESSLGLRWAGAAKALADAPRPADSNKGRFGHVLVVGGAFGSAGGKAGAPAMASLAALRAGAGLVTAAVPSPAAALVSAITPELMIQPLAATAEGEIAASNREALEDLMQRITVLAVGPGLGTNAETAEFVLALLAAEKNGKRMPCVLDADGLNILAKTPEALKAAARDRVLVLTPHPGEMARLTGLTIAAIQADRLPLARRFASEFGVTLVLKGARTLIAHPDGRVAVNTSGNPGMAKGGSGDILTGLTAAMLAQYPADAARAVEAAVYLHGLAADLAVRSPGIAGNQHCLLATDTIAHFSSAFRYRAESPEGYVWLQGSDRRFERHGGKIGGQDL